MPQYFFYNTCPKCKNIAPIDITKWQLGSVLFYDGKEQVSELSGVVYFTLFCQSCEQGIAGIFDYGLDSGHPRDLQEYDVNGDGNLTNFFSHIYKEFRFDIPPFHRAGIYNEAMFCYSGGAYTAAVSLCRIAVDVRVDLMWRRLTNKNNKNNTLFEKINELFPGNQCSQESNTSHLIRLIGNEVIHEGKHPTKKNAKLWLDLTEKFLSETDDPFNLGD